MMFYKKFATASNNPALFLAWRVQWCCLVGVAYSRHEVFMPLAIINIPSRKCWGLVAFPLLCDNSLSHTLQYCATTTHLPIANHLFLGWFTATAASHLLGGFLQCEASHRFSDTSATGLSLAFSLHFSAGQSGARVAKRADWPGPAECHVSPMDAVREETAGQCLGKAN